MADEPTWRMQRLPQRGLASLRDCGYDQDQEQPVDSEQGQPSSGWECASMQAQSYVQHS
jgi:hypothetical protein